MKHCLRALILLLGCWANAQEKSFEITGTVQDESKNPLESATIYLERERDSSLVTYTISDQKGAFTIEDRTTDTSLNLYISYVGFQTLRKNVEIKEGLISLGSLSLAIDANALDEVIIKSRAPITIKKDTLEFNVKSFKTRKDATVEDLLKVLPGVEVDEEGAITINGKPVNKILVNGKPFFGNDPTITTRNLTKEIIEKVQVVDTKTDAEAFAGEASDGQNKTINLTINEENNKGVFGRVGAGGGTDERYEGAGFFNKFDNDLRLSFLVGGNNINSPGFSFGEIRKMFGGARSMSVNSSGGFSIDGRSFGGGEGIVTSKNAGFNYADDYGKKVDVTADYFYAASDAKNESTSNRENILPDQRFFTNKTSTSNTSNDNHSANARVNIKLDSTFLINIRPSFKYGTQDRIFDREERSFNEENETTNSSSTSSRSTSTSNNFENQLDVTKRFGDRGAVLRFSMTNKFEGREGDDFLNSVTDIFGDTPEQIIRDQKTVEDFDLNSLYFRASYRIPIIAKKLFVETKFSFRDDERNNNQSTFDIDPGTEQYTDFNALLSTNFRYNNMRTTPSISLAYNDDKLRANAEVGYVFRTLKNQDFLRPDVSLKEQFEAIEANGYVNYRITTSKSLYFNYNLSNEPPDISQLQPFQDVSDPLNIVTGNPNLEPTNNHRVYMGFNNFNINSGLGFNVYGNMNLSNNDIVSQTIVDENFVRNTTYVNVDGNYSYGVNASVNSTHKLDSIRSVKYRLGFGVNTNKNINFNNGVQYASRSTFLSPSLRLTFNWKKVMDIIPNYRVSFSNTTYDLDQFGDQKFTRHTLGIETATFLPKKLEWRNNIDFSYNPNVAAGFQRTAWFWNSTLAYSILKDQGTLTLKVYDVLNQNTNARRNTSSNYIEDSQSTVLQQYAMLSFSWKFNSLGKKGETGRDNFQFYN